MRTISCEWCGAQSEARNPRKRFCSDEHRNLAHYARKNGQPPPAAKPRVIQTSGESKLVVSMRSELADLGLADSALAEQVLVVAQRLEDATSGHASISRELRILMDEARTAGKVTRTPLDELKDRRERRLAG